MKKKRLCAILLALSLLAGLLTVPAGALVVHHPIDGRFSEEDSQGRKTRLSFSDGTSLAAADYNETLGSDRPMSRFDLSRWSGYGAQVALTVPEDYELIGAADMQVVVGESEPVSDGERTGCRAYAGAVVLLTEGFCLFYTGEAAAAPETEVLYTCPAYQIVSTPIPGSTEADYEAFSDSWGLYSGLKCLRRDGKLIQLKLPGNYPYVPSVYYNSYQDGRYKMIILKDGERKHGFLDENGEVVIDFIYESSYAFSEGLAPVALNGKYGYIDTEGNTVIPFQYDWALRFYDGLAAVELDGKWGFIRKDGTVAVPICYELYHSFGEGLAPVERDGVWGYVDTGGNTVIPFQYDTDYGAEPFSEGLAKVQKNGVTQFIDKSGAVVFTVDDAEYRVIGNRAAFSDGRCPVLVDSMEGAQAVSHCGAIDTTGKLVIPAIYENALAFSGGLSLAQLDGKYGYIDVNGTTILPFIYVSATGFTDGCALAKDARGQWYCLEKRDTDAAEVPAAEPDAPSSWAQEEVAEAISAGLVPEGLRRNYTGAVTRGEAAGLFLRLLEVSTGLSTEELLSEHGAETDPAAFTDTDDPDVLAAHALGLINGVEEGRFDPDGTFTRAQIAAILNRAARVLGVETEGYGHAFTDVSGHWAEPELGWPVHAGILSGVGEGRFDPDGVLTTEQAILMTWRALEALG